MKEIDALPVNYFDESHEAKSYPSLSEKLGFSGAAAPAKPAASKSALQLGLMHFLTLEFGKGIRSSLKAPSDEFNINNDAHRAALGISMCLDKFGMADGFDASEIVLEAALTVAVVNERNTYAAAVSAGTGKKIIDQLTKLDSRRDQATTPIYPSLKAQ